MEIQLLTMLVDLILFVVRVFHPSGPRCFLAGCEVFEEIVPVADERVSVEDFAVAELAWIAVDREFLLHLVGERVLQLEVYLVFSQVFDAIGIGFQVIKLLCRAFAKVHLPKFRSAFSPLVEEYGLGRTSITVQVAGFRVAPRPTVCLVIADVEFVSLYDASNGVATVSGASDVVSFFSDEDVVALGNDLSRFG